MKKLHKLTPSLHANIWGGTRLFNYGKCADLDRIGESWELSFVPGAEALTESGEPLTKAFTKDMWGTGCEGFEAFPVLTKFIDAKDKLSVQVHPSDEYALENEGQYGKSEMWYVVDADEGAGLYMGLSRECAKEEFAARVADGTVEELLSFKEVKAGDVFFIPAGTIHAIGAGVLIFEIQQNSTLTYRLYDYMRRDKDGNLRELHIDKAMKVSDLKVYDYECKSDNPNTIGKCKYFVTNRYVLNLEEQKLDITDESYMAISCVRGEGILSYLDGAKRHSERLAPGDTYLAPAGFGEVTLSGEMTIITVETGK